MAAISKVAGEALAKETGGVTGKVFGPAAEEFGLFLRDYATRWRAERSLYTAQRAHQLLADRGIKPKGVSPKTAVAVLEGSSLEDDDRISEMWAGLLARASGIGETGAEPAFCAVLKQLGSADALILRACWAASLDPMHELSYSDDPLPRPPDSVSLSPFHGVEKANMGPFFVTAHEARQEFFDLEKVNRDSARISAFNLARLGLIRRTNGANRMLFLTEFGQDLIRACTLPAEPVGGSVEESPPPT